MFEHVEAFAGDPILSLMEKYQQDPRDNKVNLTIGLYYDAEGKVPQLSAVHQAVLAHDDDAPSPYLSIDGLASYCQAAQKLIFAEHLSLLADKRLISLQTLGGSGALKLGADFLASALPDSTVWVSRPSWENHAAIFTGAGLTVKEYPYYSSADNQVDFAAMLACIEQLPAQSIIILHPCCHNPTGADLTHQQWDQLAEVLAKNNLLPFLDMAYQGLGNGFKADGYAIDCMIRQGIRFFLSSSFSKIFSLYGERIGLLSYVGQSAQEADRVLGQLKAAVRRNYSTPPLYGAQLVAWVLADETRKQQWLAEVEGMRQRVLAMREKLVNQLQQRLPERAFAHILAQKGMFSYTGFTPEQVDRLQQEFAVYLLASGRMCVAGLNDHNIDYVANAMATVWQSFT